MPSGFVRDGREATIVSPLLKARIIEQRPVRKKIF